MQGYYGGRSEIRIRHEEIPVVVCDTTSEYPSVAALLDLWPLLTAADIGVEDCTTKARRILERASLKELLNPSFWRELAFFACVKPDGDILPVRSLYRETGDDPNIGLNPLTSEEAIWYAGPDLASSKLLRKRTPKVIRAFRVVPQGRQEGTKACSIGTRTVDPAKDEDDFFRAIIEERKSLPKTHPHYLLLKIIANSLYGIFAELNKNEYGKNKAKTLDVFSGEHKFEQLTTVIERPGRWQFPPAAALITAGAAMLAILEGMLEERGGAYLLTDTDSMLIAASEKGGMVRCRSGPAVKVIKWEQVNEICAQLNALNPYDRIIVGQILKIEDCNYDGAGKQHQLYGQLYPPSVMSFTNATGPHFKSSSPANTDWECICPDKRKRYKPKNCKDKENDYARWVVEAWDRLLADHFQNIKDPENALITNSLWFGKFPAVMRIRVTTPNVMRALRKRDPGAAKPYNFALSPILIKPPESCTLIAPMSKDPAEWLTQDYTEIRSGRTVKLFGKYRGKRLVPRILSTVIWRHYLHPEDKSLAPDGECCGPYTRGLLLRRPIRAMTPFIFIGKEIERKAQEGEDLPEGSGPLRYQAGQTGKTRAADPRLILRAKRFSGRRLRCESGVGQHAFERFLRGDPVHPSTRARLAKAVEKLERDARNPAEK